jgi:hypothetical protein
VGLVLAGLVGEQPDDFVLVQEMSRHHDEGQPAVVADVLARLQGVEQVRHHRGIPQVLAAGVVRHVVGSRRPLRIALAHDWPP